MLISGIFLSYYFLLGDDPMLRLPDVGLECFVTDLLLFVIVCFICNNKIILDNAIDRVLRSP